MQENLPKKAEEHPKTASYDFFETCSKITSFSSKMLLDYLYRDILFTLTSVPAQCAPIASKSRPLNSPLFGPNIHKGPTVVENTISMVFTENWKHFSTVLNDINMKIDQVRAQHDQFMEECPNGQMTKKKFVQLSRQVFLRTFWREWKELNAKYGKLQHRLDIATWC